MSGRSTSYRTKIEELEERGREDDRVAISVANRLIRLGVVTSLAFTTSFSKWKETAKRPLFIELSAGSDSTMIGKESTWIGFITVQYASSGVTGLRADPDVSARESNSLDPSSPFPAETVPTAAFTTSHVPSASLHRFSSKIEGEFSPRAADRDGGFLINLYITVY